MLFGGRLHESVQFRKFPLIIAGEQTSEIAKD